MTEGAKPDIGALFGASDVETFLGLPKGDLGNLSADIAILGAPCATPYKSVGAYCRNAPKALRQAIAGMAANLDRMNFDIGGPLFPDASVKAVDCGDLAFDEADSAGNRAKITEAVQAMLAANAVPVVLGGDDSIPIPMLHGFEGRGPFTILQVDAHIDWRQEHMGEPLGLSSTMRRASEMAHIDRIVQVGARGTGSAHPDDYQAALDWGVDFVLAPELHRDGLACVLDKLPRGGDVIICFDVDALDPAIVPGVIGRTPGGLTYQQAVDLILGTAARSRIAGVDFVEYVPEVDVDGLGALTVSRLIATTLGVLARQRA